MFTRPLTVQGFPQENETCHFPLIFHHNKLIFDEYLDKLVFVIYLLIKLPQKPVLRLPVPPPPPVSLEGAAVSIFICKLSIHNPTLSVNSFHHRDGLICIVNNMTR